MVKVETHRGVIDLSQAFFTKLVGKIATNCFGVANMATTGTMQQLQSALRFSPAEEKGVVVKVQGRRLVIDLHIIVTYGVNIAAICQSISHKVKYTVEEQTGLRVARVNIFVDGMLSE